MNKIRISNISLYSFAIFLVLELLKFLTQLLPINLREKIAISMLLIIVVYVFIIYNCIKQKHIINVFFMIIFLSIFFYYGQHLLAIFYPDYLFNEQVNHILDGKLSDGTIIRASYLAIECLLILFAGYNYSISKDTSNDISCSEIIDNDIRLQVMRIISWLFLIISLVPTISFLLAQYRANSIYGYLERRAMESDPNYYQIIGVNPIFSTLSKFFLISLFSLMIAYKGKRFRLIINSLFVVYFVLYYLTGSRFGLVKMLVTYFLIEALWVNPIKKQNLKKYIIIGSICVTAFALGTVFRSSGIEGFSDISFVRIGGVLWEPGITFTTISNILENCPSVVDYFYGKSVLGSILQCLPEQLRFGFFKHYSLSVSSYFSPLYYHVTNHGYGSSFIAEAYFNFGPFMVVFIFLYGKFLRYIQLKM